MIFLLTEWTRAFEVGEYNIQSIHMVTGSNVNFLEPHLYIVFVFRFFILAMKHSFFLSEGGKNPFDWGTSIYTYNSFTVCCFEMKRRSFLRMLNFDVSIIIIIVVSISFQVTAACHNNFSFLLCTPFFFRFVCCVFFSLCSFLFHFSFDVRPPYSFLFFFLWNMCETKSLFITNWVV